MIASEVRVGDVLLGYPVAEIKIIDKKDWIDGEPERVFYLEHREGRVVEDVATVRIGDKYDIPVQR